MLRILVVDGNTQETDDAHVAAGGKPTGAHYAQVLRALRKDIECTITQPARTPHAQLPPGVSLASFDGVAWTGSALNVYNLTSPVRAQIELCRAAFESGVPQFGSCWGLQVAAVAAGGEVHANPRGRELGIARRIAFTDAATRHPMLEGRQNYFDAIAVHMDEISAMPPSSTVLAGNDVSAVQAAEIHHKAGIFWGTQYHPEYDLNEIATVIQRYGARLIEAGFFADASTLAQFVNDWRSLHLHNARADLAWRYGIGADILDESIRRRELANWLDTQVFPRTAR